MFRVNLRPRACHRKRTQPPHNVVHSTIGGQHTLVLSRISSDPIKSVCQDKTTIRPSSHCFPPLMLPYIDRSTGSHLKPDSWIDQTVSRRILICLVCQRRPYRRARRPLPAPREMYITPNEEAGPATCIRGHYCHASSCSLRQGTAG